MAGVEHLVGLILTTLRHTKEIAYPPLYGALYRPPGGVRLRVKEDLPS
ncbi:hypothetical protein [Nostoc sp. NMS7]|nr:hypothetical protein [Nostoc sp. NMS7]